MIKVIQLKHFMVLACLALSYTHVKAQKVEFESLEINYGDIAKGAKGVRVFRKAQLGIASSVLLSKETKEPVKVIIVTLPEFRSKGLVKDKHTKFDYTDETNEKKVQC